MPNHKAESKLNHKLLKTFELIDDMRFHNCHVIIYLRCYFILLFVIVLNYLVKMLSKTQLFKQPISVKAAQSIQFLYTILPNP